MTSSPATATSTRPTRRAKRRQETLDEIRALALEQLATVGPSGLNLRAIAREMGMSSAGIYRYFASRDDLLVDLIAGGFDALGNELRAAVDRTDGSAERRLTAALDAYRRFARARPQVFALLFTDPVPDFAAPVDGATDVAVRAALAPLNELAAELLGLDGDEAGITTPADLPVEYAQLVLQLWASVHGFVSLEVFHHLEWADVDLDAAFEEQVVASIERLTRARRT